MGEFIGFPAETVINFNQAEEKVGVNMKERGNLILIPKLTKRYSAI